MGFAGVHIICTILAQKHRLECSLEPPYEGGSNGHPQSMFVAKNKESSTDYQLKNGIHRDMKADIILHRHVRLLLTLLKGMILALSD